MPPTTVIAYQRRRNAHYDDISISTSSIQQCQPTSICDDIANTFYMNCIQPLADLLPQHEDRERLLTEAAFERSRGAVIDGRDWNVVVWEKHLRRKKLEKKLMDQMERQQAEARLRAGAEDEASACSSSSGSFVVKPRKKKLAFSIPMMVSKRRSDSLMITSTPKKGDGTKSSDAMVCKPNLAIPVLKPSLALKKVMLLTTQQQPAPPTKKVIKSPCKISVNKKGFNVKPRLFRRRKKGSDESVADDATLSSSNPPSETSIDRDLVVTEVSAREFSANTEEQAEDDGSLSSADFGKDSKRDHTSPAAESIAVDSPDQVPVPCITIDKQQMNDSEPIVATARRTLDPTMPKKSFSARFIIDESPGRTVYDEREVDKFVSKLIPSKIAPTEFDCTDNNNEQKSKDEQSVAGTTQSLDMKALMHSISEKYSLSRDVTQSPTNQDGNESVLTDEKMPADERDGQAPADNVPTSSFEVRSAQFNDDVSFESDESPPLVISVTKRVHKSVERCPRVQAKVQTKRESRNSFNATLPPAPSYTGSPATAEPTSVDTNTNYDAKASKLNRLRMIRSAYEPSGSTQRCTKHNRRVSWADELTRTSTFVIGQYDQYTLDAEPQCSMSKPIKPTPKLDKRQEMNMPRSVDFDAPSAPPKPSLPSNGPVADASKLGRLRMARSACLDIKSYTAEQQPHDESPTCSVGKHFVESKKCDTERVEMTTHVKRDAENVPVPDATRRKMNRRARQLHQQRLQRMYSKPEPGSLLPNETSDVTNATSSKLSSSDNAVLELQRKPRNSLVEDARRVRSFQNKF